jgi:hypothetical protein
MLIECEVMHTLPVPSIAAERFGQLMIERVLTGLAARRHRKKVRAPDPPCAQRRDLGCILING